MKSSPISSKMPGKDKHEETEEEDCEYLQRGHCPTSKMEITALRSTK